MTIVIAILGVAILAVFLLSKRAVAAEEIEIEIPLTAGWNEVTYTGKKQKAGIAMQSIAEHLIIAYYYDPFAIRWVSITYDTTLEPGMVVNIKVSEDVIWRY